MPYRVKCHLRTGTVPLREFVRNSAQAAEFKVLPDDSLLLDADFATKATAAMFIKHFGGRMLNLNRPPSKNTTYRVKRIFFDYDPIVPPNENYFDWIRRFLKTHDAWNAKIFLNQDDHFMLEADFDNLEPAVELAEVFPSPAPFPQIVRMKRKKSSWEE
jgi:hypothetical protein